MRIINEMVILWLEFIFCSGIIVFCGTKLSIYGDIIAEKTGLGRAWIGLILMASVTSLPELITGISSVAIADTPNIALGDIMGSCVFNISIIALMDMLHGPAPIFHKSEHGHILSAGFGIILISLASISILVPLGLKTGLANQTIPLVWHIGLYTPAIILIYVIAIRSVFFFEKRRIAEFVGESVQAAQYGDISTKKAVNKYILNALFIIGAAAYLPFIGDRLAEETGLGRSFIGSVFIAMTTLLPEVVVSISALKIGATDMAIANLFGSNIFNILILAIDDIFYAKGSLLANVRQSCSNRFHGSPYDRDSRCKPHLSSGEKDILETRLGYHSHTPCIHCKYLSPLYSAWKRMIKGRYNSFNLTF